MMGFFDKLKEGLTKTRNSISDGLDSVFGDYSEVDDDFFEELEEVLVMADIGVPTTEKILDEVKEKMHEERLKTPEKVRELLIRTVAEQMTPDEHAYDFENEKTVIIVVGVNGVGKTTSIGKLALNYKNEGKKVLMCAADTYRAAAAEQLIIWAERGGIDIVSQKEGADPASVVYDAINSFKAHGTDIMICDTAGRLHNKKNLMNELSKIYRIIERELPDVRKEVLLVLDATTGQNAISQAKEFTSAANVNGIVLTKMDGTAKGGIAIAICSELNMPVKYIGVGEQIEDLQRFDPDAFVRAMFEE